MPLVCVCLFLVSHPPPPLSAPDIPGLWARSSAAPRPPPSPFRRFTHLFGKSWATRKALPDANYRSTRERFGYAKPLWESDHYNDVPTGVGAGTAEGGQRGGGGGTGAPFGASRVCPRTASGPDEWGGGGRQQPAHPQYANYWAPLTRKRHIPPRPAQPQHTNEGAPRTRKRHQQEHRPQRPTESSDPTQQAKGRMGDCPGPRKGATTRRHVTRGGAVGGAGSRAPFNSSAPLHWGCGVVGGGGPAGRGREGPSPAPGPHSLTGCVTWGRDVDGVPFGSLAYLCARGSVHERCRTEGRVFVIPIAE